MPKVVFDNRETDMWLSGHSNFSNPNKGINPNKIPEDMTYEEWRNKVADALNILAGLMGGYGISLVDKQGNDLSSHTNEDQQFDYADPTKKYKATFGSKMITLSSLKDN